MNAAVPQADAIYKYGRGASNPGLPPFQKILIDSLYYCRILLFLFIRFHIQADGPGNLLNFLIVELVVIFKQQIMKLPEFSLLPGGQSCNGGRPGELVTLEGKVFKYDFDGIRIFFEHLLEDRHQPGAIRSLEIIEYGDHHGCVFGALERRAAGIDILDKVDRGDLNGLVPSAG